MSDIAARTRNGRPEGTASHGQVKNTTLFLKRWLANPLQMGSVIPSSPALCRRIAALAACGSTQNTVISDGPGWHRPSSYDPPGPPVTCEPESWPSSLN